MSILIKSVFINKVFYWDILVLVSVLLLWNILTIIIVGNLLKGSIVTPILVIVLVLTLIRYRYLRLVIVLFAGIFFVLPSGLQIIGRFLQDAASNFSNFDLLFYSKNMLLILVGVLIMIFANRFIKSKVYNTK